MTSSGAEFDPLELLPDASLNRTRLANLPRAESAWVGRSAYELLSLAALRQLARACAFSAPSDDQGITWSLAAALAGSRAPRAGQAAAVVGIFGRRLGHLIATLLGGPSASPDADVSPWRTAYLRHWSQVRHVWLGGGIAAALGDHLAAAARAEAARLSPVTCAVEVAPQPAVLALIGVARSRAEPTDPAVVLDFGHSAVKRGLAHFDRGQLSSVHLLPNAPVGLTPETAAPEEVMVLVEQMLAETVATAQRWCTRLDARLVVSVASYVRGGQPWDPRGLYAPLRLRPPGGVQSYVHDGTAAARGLRAPGQAAALILLGTSLGVGFPPPPASLVPLASDFAVV